MRNLRDYLLLPLSSPNMRLLGIYVPNRKLENNQELYKNMKQIKNELGKKREKKLNI
jgi:hypothetical protein